MPLSCVFYRFFGSFGLSTKESSTIMLCATSLLVSFGGVGIVCKPLLATGLNIETSCLVYLCQGGHGTGKTGNLAVNFSRQGKHREFSKFIFLHRENGANTGKILNFLKILLLKWQQGDGAFLS